MRYLQPKHTIKLSAVSRLQALTAIACFVAMVGCGEPTGPRTFTESKTAPEQTVNGLGVLAAELHDAADVFAQGVTDPAARSQAEAAVNRLADQLLTGKVSSSRAALAQARTVLANLHDVPALEVSPVCLALDYIERRINEILNAGALNG